MIDRSHNSHPISITVAVYPTISTDILIKKKVKCKWFPYVNNKRNSLLFKMQWIDVDNIWSENDKMSIKNYCCQKKNEQKKKLIYWISFSVNVLSDKFIWQSSFFFCLELFNWRRCFYIYRSNDTWIDREKNSSSFYFDI